MFEQAAAIALGIIAGVLGLAGIVFLSALALEKIANQMWWHRQMRKHRREELERNKGST